MERRRRWLFCGSKNALFGALCFAIMTQSYQSAAQQSGSSHTSAHFRGDQGDAGQTGRRQKRDGAKSKVCLEPPIGTRDFYPEQLRSQAWLFGCFRTVAARFGFQEYDAPVLEHAELYTRKGGEEITKQMYNFTDKGGYQVTLRPEMTPSLARMVLAHQRELRLPLKWFSLPQCWRFENVQRGRKREHYQWNMDIVGVKSVAAETELLCALVDFFRSVGLSSVDVGIKVNSRKILGSLLPILGIPPEQLAGVCIVLDKLSKIGEEKVLEELKQMLEIDPVLIDRLVSVARCTSVSELEAVVDDVARGLSESEAPMLALVAEAIAEMNELLSMLSECGVADYVLFDASIVRGLAYYSGTVFECYDRLGELRAICGGGRYDKLMTLYGSKTEVPCVGFGFGDCVISELLSQRELLPDIPPRLDFVVAPYGAAMLGSAMSVALKLRQAGASVDTMLEPRRRVAQAFDYADRAGADFMAFVAPDEWAADTICIKSLRAPIPQSVMAGLRRVEAIPTVGDDRTQGEEEVEPKQAVVALSMLQPAVHELLSWAASLRQDPSPASSQSLS